MPEEFDRLEENKKTLATLIQSRASDIDAKSLVLDYFAPMLLELVESQIESYGMEEENPQAVGFNVSTYVNLQNFLSWLATEESLDRDLRRQALQHYAQLRSEVDDTPVDTILESIMEAREEPTQEPVVEEPATASKATEIVEPKKEAVEEKKPPLPKSASQTKGRKQGKDASQTKGRKQGKDASRTSAKGAS